MTRPGNIAAIEKNTGRAWSDWMTHLDAADAKTLPHNEIARFVQDE